MTELDARFKALLTRFSSLTKPLGFRKEGQNFRLFQEDGLCRIVNFQKNRYNSAEHLEFIINLGVYFEKGKTVSNGRFKEYECSIRRRISRNVPGPETWWTIEADTDMDALFEELRDALDRANAWFQLFPSKMETIEKLLSGKAQPHCGRLAMNYGTAKLLVDMGYGDRLYERIKDSKASMLAELARQIKG